MIQSVLAPEMVNNIFAIIFYSFTIIPFAYGALLFPGSRDQKPVPAAPFVFASFGLGFFALGPYLAARQFRPEVDPASLGPVASAFNSPWLGRGLLLGALALAASGVGTTFSAGGWDVPGYTELLKSSLLVRISSLDCALLSAAVAEPMREDMMRRGWYPRPAALAADEEGEEGGRKPSAAEVARLVAFAALPVVGPAAYVALRPPLLPAGAAFSPQDKVGSAGLPDR
ncbi:unnamed protein product [Phaeothamnion confervicola]